MRERKRRRKGGEKKKKVKKGSGEEGKGNEGRQWSRLTHYVPDRIQFALTTI